MAPSASMLFLSYHQLRRPAEAAPKKEEEEAGGGVRLGVSSVFSLGAFARRRETAPAVRAEWKRGRERDAGEEEKAAAELEGKFEEALRLSCWSS
ncbi:uncharacterized protein LOC133915547 [Phragmites australis]|uniref:uncharacterized protein LOC133915547 n=1 Tax=Phragmites australis TaxID=29695 RepID=UPI002D791BFE|nr:uncharacterized protein LOC133915547 [Phragmites australis]